LRSDLAVLVALIAAAHFPLLTTDGCLVTPERARAVWEAGLEAASVRLDHADPARQDAAAGVPGAHARALAGLLALGRARTRSSQQVNVKARLRDGDLAGLPDLLRLAADLGASVTVEPTFPLVHPGPRARELAEGLRELKARHDNLRSGRHFLAHLGQALEEGVGGCRAGRAFFNVDHHGRVSKCVEFRGPEERVGSLRELGMATVTDLLRGVHARNECRSCWYSYRAEVESLYTVGGFLRALPDLVRA
jgi:MoaA/NifB/PqqE/SkfB family radical SAM enzyme